jgi:hypothetical protein
MGFALKLVCVMELGVTWKYLVRFRFRHFARLRVVRGLVRPKRIAISRTFQIIFKMILD